MKKTLTLTLGLVLSPWASANDDTDLIQQLFDAGQSVEAYEIGQELQSELEGNPKFDYYYGAAAIDSGDASQGVFALERVLIQQPGNQAARLELARGYYELEEYQRSRKEFEAVMAANPPEDVKEKVQGYLDAIRLRESRYRSTATAFFRIGAGNDSNANSATDIDSSGDYTGIFVSLNGQSLAANSRAAESSFTDIAFGTNTNIPLSKNWNIVAGTDLTATIYGDDLANNFNTTAFNFRGGVQQRLGSQHKLSYLLSHQALVLQDDFYRNFSNFTVGWSWPINDTNQLQSYARLGQLDYVQTSRSNNDIESKSIGVAYLTQLSQVKFSPVISVGLNVGQDDAEKIKLTQAGTPSIFTNESLLSNDSFGINTSATLNLSQKSALRAELGFQTREYGGVQAQHNKVRKDDTVSFNLNFNHILSRRWKLNAYINHADNSANIDIYEYNRDRIGVNFTFETK